MANENTFLFHALMMGIFITFVYDIFRIFRRVIPHKSFLVSAEDICFWIYCAAEVFLMMYHESDGTLRWFAVLGALVGMMLYRKLVSPFFVKYVSLWLGVLLGCLGKIAGFVFRPVIMVRKALKKKLTILVKMFRMKI